MRFIVPVLLFVVSCAPVAPQGQPAEGGLHASVSAAPQRPLVLASAFEPEGLEASFGRGSGNTDFSTLVNGSLCYLEFPYKPMPYLAAELPRVEGGSWKMHALDRQSIVDTIYEGRTVGMHVWLHPTDPSYAAVERAITRYPYDMQRAQTLLEEAGWRRAGDGVLRNAGG